jgi:hypothetical protein
LEVIHFKVSSLQKLSTIPERGGMTVNSCSKIVVGEKLDFPRISKDSKKRAEPKGVSGKI